MPARAEVQLSDYLITGVLLVTACALFSGLGPGKFPVPDEGPARLGWALANILRHGDAGHLFGNVALVGIAGYLIEPVISRGRFVALVALSGVVGTTLEMALVDARFLGLSGVAYGMVAFAALGPARARIGLVGTLVLIVFAVAETAYLWPDVALYAHLGGAVTGGSLAMLGGLFGPKTPQLRPMEFKHLKRVIEIINETDEDDAEEAEEDLLESKFEDMFVLVKGNQVLGVTGASLAEDSDDIMWLSWTYLAEDAQGDGLGRQMIEDLLHMLNDRQVRKIFIATSDYREGGKRIYNDAHKLYKKLGAQVELEVPAYHSPFEGKIVYGFDNPNVTPDPVTLGKATGLRFTGTTRAPESEGGAALLWTENGLDVSGLDDVLNEARAKKARAVFTSLPADLSARAEEALTAADLKKIGTLKDYYAVGVDQVWWARHM